MTTPSQEAKDFAAANGFTITPNGRRYNVFHNVDGGVIEVGGYPAALNAMRMYVPQANREPQVTWAVKTNAEIIEDIADVSEDAASAAFGALSDEDKRHTLELARGVVLDAIGAYFDLDARNTDEPDEMYRRYIKYSTRTDINTPIVLSADVPFEDFNEESKARIRAAAAKIAASGPQPARWVLDVRYNGVRFEQYRCHSYADIVRKSRRELNWSRRLYGSAFVANRVVTIGYLA
jgi:hypothetical protein